MKTAILALILLVCLVACESEPPTTSFESLPAGDAERGAEIFTEIINDAPACSTCHRLDDSAQVGPGLLGIGEIAGTRVADQSAEEYLYTSIVRPARYLVTGFSNLMYNAYDEHLSSQDIADLIAYLLNL